MRVNDNNPSLSHLPSASFKTAAKIYLIQGQRSVYDCSLLKVSVKREMKIFERRFSVSLFTFDVCALGFIVTTRFCPGLVISQYL